MTCLQPFTTHRKHPNLWPAPAAVLGTGWGWFLPQLQGPWVCGSQCLQGVLRKGPRTGSQEGPTLLRGKRFFPFVWSTFLICKSCSLSREA